jgi:1-acyl-sn-glycerol-3-phosphate acyltransferase
MSLAQNAVFTPLHWIGRSLCRVHDEEVAKIPHQGPLIIVANHVNFLDVPLLYTHTRPRPITGFAKVETWKNPVIGLLFSLVGAIPLKRGTVDRSALQRALAELQAGRILVIAPEGTRSGDGRLRKARSGVAMLALLSGAPVLPVVYYGGEQFRRNLVRLRRTDFHIIVGEPFHVRSSEERISRALREQVTDEIMYRLAALLPPAYRGHYSDLSRSTSQYID